jgi:hypothetical protein
MRVSRQTSLVAFVRGGIATSCAALVFVLGLFAASPSLHAHLHGAVALGDDHQCAIAVFANGVSVPVGFEMAPPPAAHVVQWCTPGVTEIYLGSPRFLLQPERGPPQA